jgi:hypothetical protein
VTLSGRDPIAGFAHSFVRFELRADVAKARKRNGAVIVSGEPNVLKGRVEAVLTDSITPHKKVTADSGTWLSRSGVDKLEKLISRRGCIGLAILVVTGDSELASTSH